jgi:hypothetical protein
LYRTIEQKQRKSELRLEHPQYNRRKQIRQLTQAGLGLPENVVYFRSDFFDPTDTD